MLKEMNPGRWCRECGVLLLLAFALTGGATPAPTEGAKWPKETECALQRAGSNRAELERALQRAPTEQREAMQFLVVNMPQPDLELLRADFLLENVSLAYRDWQKAPWASRVTPSLFLNYILPYASLNESRDAWRAKLRLLAEPLVAECRTPAEAAASLNTKLFKQLQVKYSTQRRAPDQGPLETMESHKATCTGLSILLVDACRAVGVPARVVGTPSWTGKPGNHTWVEIWDGDWHFLGAADRGAQELDRGWFVRNASQAIKNVPEHAIYASSFRKTGLKFPLVWAPSIDYVSAEDVTDRYTASTKSLGQ